jgi:sugar phosphate isomerase/epimerase
MRIGLSSYTYTWAVGVPGFPPRNPMSPAALLARASLLGIGVVQFADNLPLDALSATELDTLAADADDRGITIEVGTRGIGPGLARYAQIAQRFGARFVRLVIDSTDDHPTPGEAVARLGEFESVFRDAGLMLAIENHDRFTCAELIGILDGLGDWSGVCLDTVNSLGALEGPKTVVAELGPRAINLHLKDFTIERQSHRMGFDVLGAPAGAGMLDVPWLVRTLGPTTVRTAILELWTPPEPTLDATIAKEAEWAERSVAYLLTTPGLTR